MWRSMSAEMLVCDKARDMKDEVHYRNTVMIDVTLPKDQHLG